MNAWLWRLVPPCSNTLTVDAVQANVADALDEKAAEMFTTAHVKKSLLSKGLQAWLAMHQEQQNATCRARGLLQRMMHSNQVHPLLARNTGIMFR